MADQSNIRLKSTYLKHTETKTSRNTFVENFMYSPFSGTRLAIQDGQPQIPWVVTVNDTIRTQNHIHFHYNFKMWQAKSLQLYLAYKKTESAPGHIA